jgi:hypothetical protein
MTKKPFAIVVIWSAMSVLPLQNAFISKPKTRATASSTTHRNYFDDVSRSTRDILPAEHNPLPWRSFLTNRTYTEEKVAAMETWLTGYDATSASIMTDQSLARQMNEWIDRAGVIGTTCGDELYETLLTTSICRSTSVIACLAHYWTNIVQLIHQHGDTAKDGQVALTVFPNCQSLYNYQQMAMINAAVDFSKGLCQYVGKKVTVTLFHPSHKNTPRMWSPAKHAPFPTAGLEFWTDGLSTKVSNSYNNHDEKKVDLTKGTTQFTSYDGYLDRGYVPNIQERRRTLELLFRSAAASSTVMSFNPEEIVSSDTVRQQTTQWMVAHVGPLFSVSTTADRWTITDSTMGEELYASIWTAIDELSQLGQDADQLEWEKKVLKRSTSPFDPLAWNDILSKQPAVVMTSMFVATKFHLYNAQTFKRFAITVNAVLKHFTGGSMSLELLHPEYVGATDADSERRRAPLPTIQICYHVQAKRKK